ncbi:MazG-like family protein [Actinocatenispora comari]|uniref:NTP pyrophosphohydrolase MazG putative catalytic core domain-containing protein n=1 Tax=Actinocatenispora comari TaxID=2807577 RepID=A0A8J4AMC0_9ACTN|nr:MazG-like family protein [Actinocatenispora comari]GIL32060.1 hypothetical protein NUM_73140 [Actinocatenispora comari]
MAARPNLPNDLELFESLHTLVAWHDKHNGRDREQQGLRIMKITEEAGEAARAWVGVVGCNPRKGVTHTTTDVVEELADVVWSALVAIESLRLDAREAVTACLAKNLDRIHDNP